MCSRVTWIVFAFALVASSLLNASSISIVFGNGMQTTREDAEHLTIVLKDAVLSDPRSSEHTIDFHLAYNTSVCRSAEHNDDTLCLRDLYEAVKQRVLDVRLRIDDLSFWQYVSRLRTTPEAEFALFSQVAVSSPSFAGPSTIFEVDLGEQVALYQSSIADGKKVVLVAHSQGNFFGNDAFDLLSQEEQQSFGMVSVATPAQDVLSNSSCAARYTNLEEDPIYKVTLSLKPNLSNFEGGYAGEPQWKFHDFAEWYMSFRSPSQLKILDDIFNLTTSLRDPVSQPVNPNTLVVLDTSFNRLLIVDPVSGTSRSLMNVSRDFLSGLAYDRVSRRLYSTDLETNELIELDLRQRTERSIGRVGVPHVGDLTFGPGNRLFGMASGESSSSRLVQIDLSTGIGVPREAVLFGGSRALAYDPDSARMYTFTNGLFGNLSEIDPSTGAETLVSIGHRGVVYMADQPDSPEIFSIGREPLTGRINQVGSFNLRAPFFIPFTSIGASLSGIEMISLDGIAVSSNQPPVIRFTSEGGRFGDSYPMTWIDEDPDSSAFISLFYSTDPSCKDPVLIAQGISEDDTTDLYVWDISSLSAGSYYLYASISDGSEAATACNRSVITVDH